MTLRWKDIPGSDFDCFSGQVEVEVASDERVVSVERILDGGYNTAYVRVWIAKLP